MPKNHPTDKQVKAVEAAMKAAMQAPVPDGVQPSIRLNLEPKSKKWFIYKGWEKPPKGV